jgi:hypothetical protein
MVSEREKLRRRDIGRQRFRLLLVATWIMRRRQFLGLTRGLAFSLIPFVLRHANSVAARLARSVMPLRVRRLLIRSLMQSILFWPYRSRFAVSSPRLSAILADLKAAFLATRTNTATLRFLFLIRDGTIDGNE